MNFNLSNIKMGRSRNGYSLNAIFIIDNTPIAHWEQMMNRVTKLKNNYK